MSTPERFGHPRPLPVRLRPTNRQFAKFLAAVLLTWLVLWVVSAPTLPTALIVGGVGLVGVMIAKKPA